MKVKTDFEFLEELLNTYPEMEVLLQSGTITNKITRNVMSIDRYVMDQLFQDMMMHGIIYAVTGSSYRGRDEVVQYLHNKNGEE